MVVVTLCKFNPISDNDMVWKHHYFQLHNSLPEKANFSWKTMYVETKKSWHGSTWSPMRNYPSNKIVEYRRFNIGVFGEEGAGKSCITRMFVENIFAGDIGTIMSYFFLIFLDPREIDSFKTIIQVDNKNVVLEILDTAYQEGKFPGSFFNQN
jgi:hypothetical protein